MCDKTNEERREKYIALRRKGFPTEWARKSRDIYVDQADREVERFLTWAAREANEEVK